MSEDVKIRKYQLSPGNFLTMFSGGGVERSEHVHLIDGSDGGFAMAATGFKSRLRGVGAGSRVDGP